MLRFGVFAFLLFAGSVGVFAQRLMSSAVIPLKIENLKVDSKHGKQEVTSDVPAIHNYMNWIQGQTGYDMSKMKGWAHEMQFIEKGRYKEFVGFLIDGQKQMRYMDVWATAKGDKLELEFMHMMASATAITNYRMRYCKTRRAGGLGGLFGKKKTSCYDQLQKRGITSEEIQTLANAMKEAINQRIRK